MKNWKNPQEHKEKIDRYQPELYLQEKKEGIRAGNLWIIGLILLLLISLPRMVQMNRDAKARERETTALAISMQYDGAAQLEVLKGITASIQPDLSNPLTLSHITQQQANSYLYHLTPHEPDHDIYIAVPQVYEVLQFSLPREVPLVEGIRITLPDGRDWFVIQSVEYDAVREHTVSITLSPLLDAVPPPMTLVAGEFQTTITPKTNLNIVDRNKQQWNGEPTPSKSRMKYGGRTAACRREPTLLSIRPASKWNPASCPFLPWGIKFTW